jgi:hypothetical protein
MEASEMSSVSVGHVKTPHTHEDWLQERPSHPDACVYNWYLRYIVLRVSKLPSFRSSFALYIIQGRG